ncbi:DUF1344 domain-containing protein [Devosia neptuniae]|jgi:curli biogenesis system outer membrane secretion channel CsgG|uniref:DUF1344 domain-containing protein n=1 Tax=Devosia neptuniae TaxID=191302 RepID=A0ABY6CCU5_9HYPH|nr:DUF1344 domain-containing protein [Devosia neptuniae]UXN68952.1 DUF1344 domain-containing protein [Devosia neptuniae]
MRKIIVPVVLAFVVGTSGMAFAATTTPMAPAAKPAAAATIAGPQTISSTVKAFDLKSHTLTLANGVAYKLPATFKDPGLKAGSKVTVKWQQNGKEYDASSVTLG